QAIHLAIFVPGQQSKLALCLAGLTCFLYTPHFLGSILIHEGQRAESLFFIADWFSIVGIDFVLSCWTSS
ncbi:hypothetical protein EG68_12259, partial [Paragonimus skrjabini miyazakii]